jgi:A/G-specific adenine glycosylase
LNQSLMELGALVCTPASPRCQECPVQSHCVAFGTGRVPLLPTPFKRPAPVAKRVAAFVVEHRGRFLLHQRPLHSVNGGLWEFPNAEIPKSGGIRKAAQTVLGVVPDGLKRRFAIRHSITRFRIELVTYSGRLPQKAGGCPKPPQPRRMWVTPGQLTDLTLPSAHRRIAQGLVAATPRIASEGRRPANSR